MIATIDGIPVYNALISDDDEGMLRVSLVDFPAVMTDFLKFKEQDKIEKECVKFSIKDEDKRLVYGVLMRSDFPIYRVNGSFEYYIYFDSETIRQMAEKYLKESRQNNVNLMHEDGSDVNGVDMVQMFIKDSEKGVNPTGFEDIADGSLFAEYHVTNDDVWAEIKNGTYRGFSLEGVFNLEPEEDENYIKRIVDELDGKFSQILKRINKMGKMKRFKESLKKALTEMGSVTTDKSILVWDGEEDLTEGFEVFVEDSEGNRTPAESGEYITDDGKTIVVVDGKVSEIIDNQAEVAEEETEEEKVEEVNADEAEDIEAIKKEIEGIHLEINELYKLVDRLLKEAGLTRDEADSEETAMSAMKAEVEKMQKEIEEIKSAPAAKSVHEEFEHASSEHKFESKAARILAAKNR